VRQPRQNRRLSTETSTHDRGVDVVGGPGDLDRHPQVTVDPASQVDVAVYSLTEFALDHEVLEAESLV
jgi:hypothetical protein